MALELYVTGKQRNNYYNCIHILKPKCTALVAEWESSMVGCSRLKAIVIPAIAGFFGSQIQAPALPGLFGLHSWLRKLKFIS